MRDKNHRGAPAGFGKAAGIAVCLVLALSAAFPAAAEKKNKPEEPLRVLGMEFVRVPAGEFEMGADDVDAFANEKPVHRVSVVEFLIAKSEVTQAQWTAVMGSNPSRFAGCDDCPVEKVSWKDVQEFIRKANAQTGLSMRLPTEAEWEYAARGGARQQKWAGADKVHELDAYAWYDRNSEGRTHPVCQKKPNAFGLCDMTGNVYEWVADRYDIAYGATAPPVDPADPNADFPRVLRGGGWGYSARIARAAYRGGNPPTISSGSIGFRLVLPAVRQPEPAGSPRP